MPGFSCEPDRTEMINSFPRADRPCLVMRSLVVEDARVSQLILAKILSTYGECQMASSGYDALQAFNRAFVERQPFDLICLDLGLPDFDGVEVLAEIRAVEQARGVPPARRVHVIAVTASSDMDAVHALAEMGDGYVLKPINREKLIQILVRLGLIPPGSHPETGS